MGREESGLKIIIWIIVGGVAAWILSASLSGLTPSEDTPHAATGCSASRRAISERLKSPSSAKWVDCHSTTSNGVQTVVTTVDSQNSFGAMLRTQWVTKVRNNTVESVTQSR